TTRADFPEDYDAIQGQEPATVISRGGSCIVAPNGKIVAGPDFDGEAILVADLDMGDIARGKYDFDVVGHYSRPDVFQLSVNETPQSAVRTFGQPGVTGAGTATSTEAGLEAAQSASTRPPRQD